MRDMVPNHILQLVTLTAMEPPISFHADAVRDEQAKILHAIQPLAPEDVLTRAVRGQYGEGKVDDQALPAYRHEPNVAPDSAHRNLRGDSSSPSTTGAGPMCRSISAPASGSRSRVTEVAIQFRRAPFVLFRDTPVEKLAPNLLVLHIQPDEGISLRFGAKIPGIQVDIGAVDMDFRYQDYFGNEPSTGYERLLYDCMTGDATLFQRADMVEAGWSVVQPVLDVWKALPPRNFPNYAAGSWGPKEADDLMARDHRRWRIP